MSLADAENKEVEKQEPVFDGDIDLSAVRKKMFRIDGDNNRFIELNTSDMNILSRLTEAYPKLEKLQAKAIKISEDLNTQNGEDFDEVKLGKDLKGIDNDMRNIIDDIFASNVSEVCAGEGSMFDPFGGVCRYEHIINVLIKLYDDNISAEADQLKKNVEKHTSKYTKRK